MGLNIGDVEWRRMGSRPATVEHERGRALVRQGLLHDQHAVYAYELRDPGQHLRQLVLQRIRGEQPRATLGHRLRQAITSLELSEVEITLHRARNSSHSGNNAAAYAGGRAGKSSINPLRSPEIPVAEARVTIQNPLVAFVPQVQQRRCTLHRGRTEGGRTATVPLTPLMGTCRTKGFYAISGGANSAPGDPGRGHFGGIEIDHGAYASALLRP